MTETFMEHEARQAPTRIRDQLVANETTMQLLGEILRKSPPTGVMIIGRGSSDHAGVFAKYLIEIEAGVPVYAAAPSVASVYGQKLKLEGYLVIVLSQSGQSPDIITQAKVAKYSGATVVALVNDETSPLRDIADAFIELGAGQEKSVAATKSYLCTLSSLAQLTAAWTQNASLMQGLYDLPAQLEQVLACDAQLCAEQLRGLRNMVVLGRGLGYAASKEVALKLKEVCSIHAESFSSAEFLHGPVTLVEQQLSILELNVNDESMAAHHKQVEEVAKRGAKILHLRNTCTGVHKRLEAIALLQRIYVDIAAVAVALGFSPDQPQGLKKVTKTV